MRGAGGAGRRVSQRRLWCHSKNEFSSKLGEFMGKNAGSIINDG